MCEQGNAQIKKSETLFHPLLHFWSTTIIWSQQTSRVTKPASAYTHVKASLYTCHNLFLSVSWLLTCFIWSHISIKGSVPTAQTAMGICSVLWVTCFVLWGALILPHCPIFLEIVLVPGSFSPCDWQRQSVGAAPSEPWIRRISLTSPSTSQSRASTPTYVWLLLESTRQILIAQREFASLRIKYRGDELQAGILLIGHP